jgi:hypothetical protein
MLGSSCGVKRESLMPDIDYTDPEILASVDPIFWATHNKIKLMGNTEFTLEGCEYMADIMRDPARWIGVMKGTQARITTAFMLRLMHSVIYGKYPQGGIYYFPKKEAVESFSKTRFGPLIADNPCIKRYLKRTNSVNIKQVGKAFLSLLGAGATASIEGKKDGTGVRSTPADEVVRDERDLFDDDMAGMTFDRLLNSKFKKEVDLGSPTIPDVGIDMVFGKSDQKMRMIKCHACDSYTCITEEFPHSIQFRKSDHHSRFVPYFACIKCKAEIHPRDGIYVPKFPDRYNPKYPNEGVSGYHVSHFITPNCDLSLVMEKYEEAQTDTAKMGLFYNRFLGLPWIDVEDRLMQQDVFNCCGNDMMKTRSEVGTAMGADIMKTNRVVIAEKKPKGGAKIIHMSRVSGFDALYDLAKRFNVKSAVVCLRPYEESFRKFQAKCKPEGIKVYGSEYRDKQKKLFATDDESGTYVVHRTEAMDKSQSWIRSGKLEIPRKGAEVKVFAKECCNTAKTLETNEKTGDRVYRYRPVGDKQEHYRHCVNYLQLALMNLSDYDYVPQTLGPHRSEEEYDVMGWGL